MKESASPAPLRYDGGFGVGLDPPGPTAYPDPRREGHAGSIAELGGESDVDALVRMWTTLYN